MQIFLEGQSGKMDNISKCPKTPLAPIASHGSAEDLVEYPDFMEADENEEVRVAGSMSGANRICE